MSASAGHNPLLQSGDASMRVRSCTWNEVRGTTKVPAIPAVAQLGVSLAAQFGGLASRPCRDKCDHLLRQLQEARAAVQQVRVRLDREAA
jgi:hypothetical protein